MEREDGKGKMGKGKGEGVEESEEREEGEGKEREQRKGRAGVGGHYERACVPCGWAWLCGKRSGDWEVTPGLALFGAGGWVGGGSCPLSFDGSSPLGGLFASDPHLNGPFAET